MPHICSGFDYLSEGYEGSCKAWDSEAAYAATDLEADVQSTLVAINDIVKSSL